MGSETCKNMVIFYKIYYIFYFIYFTCMPFIINIGSMSAERREAGSSLYVATKSAVQGFTESLRKEVNQDGIRVALIEPGAVGTDLNDLPPEKQRQMEAELKMLKAEDIANYIYFILTEPQRVDVIVGEIRPHLQII